MKIASFVRMGRPGFGAVIDGGIVDLTGRLAPGVRTLRGAIALGLLARADEHIAGAHPDFGLSDIALLPVIPDPGKILCVGLNYETHRVETKRAESQFPAIFTRFPDSQVAHRQNLVKPRNSERFDFEGELAVIVGKGGRYIDAGAALSHVAGFACYNDGSIRDWQRHTHQFTPGKTFPGTGAFGPYLVTSDEVGDYRKLRLQTRLNGTVVQDATLGDMIFPVAEIISYLSQFTPLAPGDVIVTGTPGGVGDRREPPLYMQGGDVVEVEIGSIGTLWNRVVEEE